MTFTPEQVAELDAPLSRAHVKKNPRGYDYVESWRAESEANRIFGHDGWSSIVLETKCVMERERKLGSGNNQYPGWGVTYTAIVRVTAGGQTRDGAGAGHGMDKDLGLAHESAIKEATSDAEKRAFKTFGNPFGLALYDKAQENVEPEQGRSAAPPAGQKALTGKTISSELDAFIVAMKMNKTVEKVDAWAAREAVAIMKLPKPDQDAMQAAYDAWRKECITKPAAVAQTQTKGPTGKTLADRAAVFEGALKACTDQDQLRRTYDAAIRLREDLDKHDPERLAEVNSIYEGLFITIEGKAA